MTVSKATSVVKPSTATTTPVLITETEVRLGTAAALAPPRRRFGRPHPVSSTLARWHARAAERRHLHHDQPSRLRYLEDSLMSREMDRL
ncbi:hypothetical protein ACWDTP_26165 [Mycobacterium sp. NPDC003449]